MSSKGVSQGVRGQGESFSYTSYSTIENDKKISNLRNPEKTRKKALSLL